MCDILVWPAETSPRTASAWTRRSWRGSARHWTGQEVIREEKAGVTEEISSRFSRHGWVYLFQWWLRLFFYNIVVITILLQWNLRFSVVSCFELPLWEQHVALEGKCSSAAQTYMAQEAELVVFPPEAAVVGAGRPALPWPTKTERREIHLVKFSLLKQNSHGFQCISGEYEKT